MAKIIYLADYKEQKFRIHFKIGHTYRFKDLPISNNVVFCSLHPLHKDFLLLIKTEEARAKRIGNMPEFKSKGPEDAINNVFKDSCGFYTLGPDDLVRIITHFTEEQMSFSRKSNGF